jgi:hypothetical protein
MKAFRIKLWLSLPLSEAKKMTISFISDPNLS